MIKFMFFFRSVLILEFVKSSDKRALMSTDASGLLEVAGWHLFGRVRTPERGGADFEGLTRA